MAESTLEARVEAGSDGPTIHLAGRLDRDADTAMAEAWTTAVAMGGASVTLDFAAADYINSTGIALIVRILADARRLELPIRARGLTEHYREIFRITRLSDFMTIEEDAVAADGQREAEPDA